MSPDRPLHISTPHELVLHELLTEEEYRHYGIPVTPGVRSYVVMTRPHAERAKEALQETGLQRTDK